MAAIYILKDQTNFVKILVNNQEIGNVYPKLSLAYKSRGGEMEEVSVELVNGNASKILIPYSPWEMFLKTDGEAFTDFSEFITYLDGIFT